MPNSNFISEILEIKDLIVENIETTPEEVNIFFKLERRDHVCPVCGAATQKDADGALNYSVTITALVYTDTTVTPNVDHMYKIIGDRTA